MDLIHGNGRERSGARCLRGLALLSTALMLASALPLFGAEHILSQSQMRAAVTEHQLAVRQCRNSLLDMLGAPKARTALKSAGIEFRQVEQAVASLDDATAQRLAQRAAHAKDEFAAGSLSNEQLTYIVIALATAVIVLIAVN